MRENNIIMALGSDFCPNAFCYNMSLVMHYACVNYRMTPQEAMIAATLNSAYSLNRSDKVGSI
jgi:imidazolonepropionase